MNWFSSINKKCVSVLSDDCSPDRTRASCCLLQQTGSVSVVVSEVCLLLLLLLHTSLEEADDDDDPEYNFLEDMDEPDLEDYRTDRAVQITSRCLHPFPVSLSDQSCRRHVDSLDLNS